MGADTELSTPPPPEPGRSPGPEDRDRGHGHRSWKADMMSALGESVSFGRFLDEPLDWGKWSAFAHNRHLEEAARQSLPGSVAQKKAFFEAHYARKRKSDGDSDPDDEGEGEGEGAGPPGLGIDAADGAAASSPDSSCMTEEPAGEEARGVDSDAVGSGGAVCAGSAEEIQPIATGRDVSSCRVAAPDERCHGEDDAQAGEARHTSPLSEEKPRDGNLVDPGVVEKQPLKESSTVNQVETDSAKKRRISMSSLLQKPAKSSSPPSGKKGTTPSSAKRRSQLNSAKENSSPQPGNNNSEQAAASVHQKRSTLTALHMSMNFTRCEASNAATSSRNLGSTIAERISQLESVTKPLPELSELRPSKKAISKGVPENASRTSQFEEQRSSHVTRVKEKLFGSASPSVHQKNNITKEQTSRGKVNDASEFKESRQSFCFKSRALPNFCWKNKQAKDSSKQIAQEITNFPNIHHLLNDVSCAHPMSKGATKEKQICCFPLRRLC